MWLLSDIKRHETLNFLLRKIIENPKQLLVLILLERSFVFIWIWFYLEKKTRKISKNSCWNAKHNTNEKCACVRVSGWLCGCGCERERVRERERERGDLK